MRRRIVSFLLAGLIFVGGSSTAAFAQSSDMFSKDKMEKFGQYYKEKVKKQPGGILSKFSRRNYVKKIDKEKIYEAARKSSFADKFKK